MPSGRTHDRITLWTLPVVAGVTLAITRNGQATLMICAGYFFGGLMLGPDLDLHSIHYKRWGWLRWIWLPYQGSLRHRSPYSHAPIIGTTLRVIYLLAWLGLFSYLVMALMNEVWQTGWTWGQIGRLLATFLNRYKAEAIALCIGLELGAFSHYTADWLSSETKRKKKSKRKSED
ncbi:MAG: metal-binding protein [Oculatellaceae cyanobacterium Prado106]|jgi:uncharacterized metal-binding protein|nr:metal-binding protein [Oculatellaceae cyanobacterium Prado106]